MREIKFRVWDADNNEMLGPFDLTQNPIYWADKMRDGVLMQYTGLKGVNGREIYEGDILEVNHPTNKAFSGVFTVEISPETMNFVAGAFNLGSGVYKYCKVIGNIYKNKELLEEK